MGNASKWFRGLLGLKKPDTSQPPTVSSSDVKHPKKKWSFVKSYREKEDQQSRYRQQPRTPVVLVPAGNGEDPSKHAIAVAAATAAVAEAAVAAAHAAAAVVRLTSSGRAISAHANSSTAAAASARVTSCGSRNAAAAPPANVSAGGACYGNREEWAAVMIQSRFRAYLSRKALRALKALVKLQAIVRGRIVRKHNARQKRELLRAHTLPASGRGWLFESPHKAANQIHCLGPPTPENFDHVARANLFYRRNGSKNSRYRPDQNCRDEGSNVKTGLRYNDRNDKTIQIDTGKKTHIVPKRRNLFHSSHLSIGSDQYTNSFSTSKDSTPHQTYPSLSSFELQSTSPLKFCGDADEDPFCTAENSPQFHSASSKVGDQKRGPFTPTKSDGSRSCLSGYSDHPNYMSCTESSKAKMRSLSAPKQRPQFERSSSTKRFSIYGYGESKIHPPPQRASSTLRANFASKAYPGSGRLDRLGMSVRDEFTGFSGVHWHRY